MNKMKLKGICVAVTLLLILTSISIIGSSNTVDDEEIGNWRLIVNISNDEQTMYEGHLRVYLVEPVSRWNMYDGNPYHYALLDFMVDEPVSIDNIYEKNITWDPDNVGEIDENNLMVIAALFNATAHQKYSYRNPDRPFDAYYVDAAAGTRPDNTGYNQVTDDFTHTVFAEEGTATWCPNCPSAADALNDIYESGDYPFYFVSLVTNRNKDAEKRAFDYNIYGIPITYFDGGYQLTIGGGNVENTYRNQIELCGERPVPDLNLSVSFFWDPDVSPPDITITHPEKNGLYLFNEKKKEINNTIIIGTTSIEVSTSDSESTVERVEFYINDELREEDEFQPFSFSNWNENKLFGRYEIKVIAYDEADNQGVATLDVLRFF